MGQKTGHRQWSVRACSGWQDDVRRLLDAPTCHSPWQVVWPVIQTNV